MRMTVASNGNVGIGTASPMDKLSIEKGNLFIRKGDLKFETISSPNALASNDISCSGSSLGINRYYVISYVTDPNLKGETKPSLNSLGVDCNGTAQITLPTADPGLSINIYRYTTSDSKDPSIMEDLKSKYKLIAEMKIPGSIYSDSDNNFNDDAGRPPREINTSAGGIWVKEQNQNDFLQVIGFQRSNDKTSLRITGEIIGRALSGEDADINKQGKVRMKWVDEINSNEVGEGWYPYAVYAP